MKQIRAFKKNPEIHRDRVHRRRKHESGMSLLEVVLSMGILVIASMTVATSTTSSFQAVDRSEVTIRVENAVREAMESVRAVSFNGLDALDGNQLHTNDPTRKIIITLRINQVSPSLKAIEVEVHKKARNSTNQVVPGELIFQALTYRSQR